MPLKRLTTISIEFFFFLLFLFPAEALSDIKDIELSTIPSLNRVRPHSQSTRIILKVLNLSGTEVEVDRFRVTLIAPSGGWIFPTDIPLIEKTPLFEMNLLPQKGEVQWEYSFPIRGIYLLRVGVVDRAGNKFSKEFNFEVKESGAKWLLLSLFTLSLFALGVIAGWIFSLNEKAALIVMSLLTVSPLLIAAVSGNAWLAEIKARRNEASPVLHVSHSEVGSPSELHWRFASLKSGYLPKSYLTLAITHLEKGDRIFFLEKTLTMGDFKMKFHFTDSSRYRVSILSTVQANMPIKVEKTVDVVSKNPTWQNTLPPVILFLGIVALGLLVGRIAYKRKQGFA